MAYFFNKSIFRARVIFNFARSVNVYFSWNNYIFQGDLDKAKYVRKA